MACRARDRTYSIIDTFRKRPPKTDVGHQTLLTLAGALLRIVRRSLEPGNYIGRGTTPIAVEHFDSDELCSLSDAVCLGPDCACDVGAMARAISRAVFARCILSLVYEVSFVSHVVRLCTLRTDEKFSACEYASVTGEGYDSSRVILRKMIHTVFKVWMLEGDTCVNDIRARALASCGVVCVRSASWRTRRDAGQAPRSIFLLHKAVGVHHSVRLNIFDLVVNKS